MAISLHVQHRDEEGFSLEACSFAPGTWSNRAGVSNIFDTNSSNADWTAKFVLALVSTKRHPCLRAKSCPSAVSTCLEEACMYWPMMERWLSAYNKRLQEKARMQTNGMML